LSGLSSNRTGEKHNKSSKACIYKIVIEYSHCTYARYLFNKEVVMSEKNNVDDLVGKIGNLDLKRKNSDEHEVSSDANPDDDEVKKVANWIRESKKIVIISGAGVSCGAGIPDFRTPGTGLYDNLQEYHLPYPEAIFDVDFYVRRPHPFLTLAKKIWPGLRHSPTFTHSFVAVLARKDKLLRNYTQNFDGLELLASVPEEKVMECHGHFRSASCITCSKPMDGIKCKEIILNSNEVPKCDAPKCNGFVKPDIVFFGEGLPERFFNLLSKDVEDIDLLLVIGTSLHVAPVSNIPSFVDCRRVLINRETVGDFSVGSGKDAVILGDCDTTIMRIARELDWEDEIRKLNKETFISISES
jgi:NAD-dependent SIR2 family protein deacetylase